VRGCALGFPPAGWSPFIKIILAIAGLLGLGLIVWLVLDAGAAAVGDAMLLLGWALIPITLFHLIPLAISTQSWRHMLPREGTPGFGTLIGIRWIRESINNLLPVGGVGGDLLGARLVYHRGVPGPVALGSVVVDITVGLLTQLFFVAVGLALLLAYSTEPAVLTVVGSILAGLGIFFGVIIVFFLLQNRGMMAFGAKIAGGLMGQARKDRMIDRAADVDGAMKAIYRDRRIWKATVWRIAGWFIGAGEVWLVMYFLGKPIGFAEAMVLESFAVAVRSAAFLIPGAVGVQEGAFIIFGGLFGIAAPDALAISLAKRVRELGLGLPGLAAWQIVEGRRIFRQ